MFVSPSGCGVPVRAPKRCYELPHLTNCAIDQASRHYGIVNGHDGEGIAGTRFGVDALTSAELRLQMSLFVMETVTTRRDGQDILIDAKLKLYRCDDSKGREKRY